MSAPDDIGRVAVLNSGGVRMTVVDVVGPERRLRCFWLTAAGDSGGTTVPRCALTFVDEPTAKPAPVDLPLAGVRVGPLWKRGATHTRHDYGSNRDSIVSVTYGSGAWEVWSPRPSVALLESGMADSREEADAVSGACLRALGAVMMYEAADEPAAIAPERGRPLSGVRLGPWVDAPHERQRWGTGDPEPCRAVAAVFLAIQEWEIFEYGPDAAELLTGKFVDGDDVESVVDAHLRSLGAILPGDDTQPPPKFHPACPTCKREFAK